MSIHKYRLKSSFGYRAVITLSPTKQISKKFKKKIDAEHWEREQRRVFKEDALNLKYAAMTLKDLSGYWMENYPKVQCFYLKNNLADFELRKYFV